MKLITDNEQAKELIKHWKSMLPSNQSIAARSRNDPEILARLSEQICRIESLDQRSCGVQEVSEIVGYGWTSCTTCGAVGDLVEIGDADEYGQLGAFLCQSCCQRALNLFQQSA